MHIPTPIPATPVLATPATPAPAPATPTEWLVCGYIADCTVCESSTVYVQFALAVRGARAHARGGHIVLLSPCPLRLHAGSYIYCDGSVEAGDAS